VIEFATNGREGRNQAAPSSVENLVDPGRDSSAGAARSRAHQAKLLLAIIPHTGLSICWRSIINSVSSGSHSTLTALIEPHSAEAEEKSLKLVEDFDNELIHAMDSLPEKSFGLLDQFRFWSAKHLRRAVNAFVVVRRYGRLDGSKFLVRPALEMAFRLEAARHHADMFYRIAHEDHRQNKHLLRIGGDDPKLQAQIDKNWKKFEKAFVREFSTVPPQCE
jgi:hypothetical protein